MEKWNNTVSPLCVLGHLIAVLLHNISSLKRLKFTSANLRLDTRVRNQFRTVHVFIHSLLCTSCKYRERAQLTSRLLYRIPSFVIKCVFLPLSDIIHQIILYIPIIFLYNVYNIFTLIILMSTSQLGQMSAGFIHRE
jgi:hypothetical protein